MSSKNYLLVLSTLLCWISLASAESAEFLAEPCDYNNPECTYTVNFYVPHTDYDDTVANPNAPDSTAYRTEARGILEDFETQINDYLQDQSVCVKLVANIKDWSIKHRKHIYLDDDENGSFEPDPDTAYLGVNELSNGAFTLTDNKFIHPVVLPGDTTQPIPNILAFGDGVLPLAERTGQEGLIEGFNADNIAGELSLVAFYNVRFPIIFNGIPSEEVGKTYGTGRINIRAGTYEDLGSFAVIPIQPTGVPTHPEPVATTFHEIFGHLIFNKAGYPSGDDSTGASKAFDHHTQAPNRQTLPDDNYMIPGGPLLLSESTVHPSQKELLEECIVGKKKTPGGGGGGGGSPPRRGPGSGVTKPPWDGNGPEYGITLKLLCQVNPVTGDCEKHRLNQRDDGECKPDAVGGCSWVEKSP